jgi:hypothetical protein
MVAAFLHVRRWCELCNTDDEQKDKGKETGLQKAKNNFLHLARYKTKLRNTLKSGEVPLREIAVIFVFLFVPQYKLD